MRPANRKSPEFKGVIEVQRKRFSDAELVGSKVRLRPIRPEDAPFAYAQLRDDQVTRTLRWDGPSSVEELTAGYGDRARWWKDGTGCYDFALEQLTDPTIIGSIEARVQAYPQQIQLGFWLTVLHWGNGYVTDATRLAVHFAFRHLDAQRVAAEVFVGNDASRRVLEKCGFHFDGTLRSQVFKQGEWKDEWAYSLLRDEWECNRDWYRPQMERVVAC